MFFMINLWCTICHYFRRIGAFLIGTAELANSVPIVPQEDHIAITILTGGETSATRESGDIEAGTGESTDVHGISPAPPVSDWVRLTDLYIGISEKTEIFIRAGDSYTRVFTSQAKMSSSKLSEIILAISGQAFASLVGNALTGSYSSTEWKILAVVTAVGFISTLISILHQHRDYSNFLMTNVRRNGGTNNTPTDVDEDSTEGNRISCAKLQSILAKLGAVSVSSAVIGSMGMFLHVDKIWTWGITGILSLVPVIAVALA